MKLQMIVWTCCIGLCGCSTAPNTPKVAFPEIGAVSYDAFDGRTWVLHEKGSAPDGSHSLRFTPQAVGKNEWKELLGFGFGYDRFSQAVMRKNFEALQAYDPAATYSIEGTPESFVMKYSLSRQGEKGITRVVRSASGFYYISYQERLGDSGEQQLAKWTRYISELPDQALLPTPSS